MRTDIFFSDGGGGCKHISWISLILRLKKKRWSCAKGTDGMTTSEYKKNCEIYIYIYILYIYAFLHYISLAFCIISSLSKKKPSEWWMLRLDAYFFFRKKDIDTTIVTRWHARWWESHGEGDSWMWPLLSQHSFFFTAIKTMSKREESDKLKLGLVVLIVKAAYRHTTIASVSSFGKKL